MLKNKLRASVVIATLNRQELLLEMLKRLLQDKADILEIIIVDQTEELSQKLQQFINSEPIIKYYYLAEKKLTIARNFGWKKAQGEIVVFLDDDAMVFKGLVKAHLNNYYDSWVGAVTGKEILEDKPNFSTSGQAQIVSKRGEIIHNPTAKTKGVADSCWGANMSIRRDLIKKLGGFDNDILLIRDESDLSMRLRLAGFKIIFEPKAKIIHKTAKSGGTRFDKRMDWYSKFFHDEIYFQLKFFSHRYLLNFYLRKFRPILACMFWYGKGHPRALILPFLAFRAGKKTYKKNKCSQYVPKRIGIDAHHLSTRVKTGKEEYGYNLLRGLADIKEPNLFFIYAKNKPDFKLPYRFNWRLIHPLSLFWYLNVLWQMNRDGIDILFCPTSYVLASLKPKISLPVVHDLAVLKSDFKSKPRAKAVETRLLKKIVKCPRIITVSEFTKHDLIKHFPLANKEKISVIYPGVHFKNQPREKLSQLALTKFKLKKPYILGVGTIEPRKNFQGLIKAYLALPQKIQEKYDLVFAGSFGWYSEEIINETKMAEDKIKFLGYMEEKELSAIFSKASMFVLPSFWEGFGIPVLEAFYFKVPVICSSVSSLPEVAGDAAILIDPKKIDSIKKAIVSLDDENLQNNLRIKGLKRLEQFSYKKSVDNLNKIFEDFLC
ncbi:MAG: glycosyltransferase [Patescibacteria group bacterium]|nr:glycosyltransferase [Patescibacteria group bacterium]